MAFKATTMAIVSPTCCLNRSNSRAKRPRITMAKKTEEAMRTGRYILYANSGARCFTSIPMLKGIAKTTIKVLKISPVGEAILAASAK